jgi:A/G-specific adenine glycosylase
MSFYERITKWYSLNYRELPWRTTQDPYKIWLSEVILQQTRVEQGRPYYQRFIETYPDVKDLAQAPEEEVLRLWQGLGYYNRGRNLHATAKQISEQYGGFFPDNREQLLTLKGIGPYTSAAIASFSFNEAAVVVDGNVYRLLSRYLGIHEDIKAPNSYKIFEKHALNLLSQRPSAPFNQAMMELGGQVCKPKQPDCSNCPISIDCYAYHSGKMEELPIKSKKQPSKQVEINYLIVRSENQILMRQRPSNGIWAKLFDFPEIEAVEPMLSSVDGERSIVLEGKRLIIQKRPEKFKHLLSHRSLLISVYQLYLATKESQTAFTHFGNFYHLDQVDSLPKPQIIHRILEYLIE